ncbi:MAG: polysaccharide deacetylase family protein [Deltaproteobacteria bacterium]|nr:polysaccharide deacetylase family protein [Deltaproteobacteria bacterium]
MKSSNYLRHTPSQNFPNASLVLKNGTLVLMYHAVTDERRGSAYVSPKTFERQIRQLKNQGYTFITPRDLLEGKGGGKSVLLTFDDWYKDFYNNVFPILKKFGVKVRSSL